MGACSSNENDLLEGVPAGVDDVFEPHYQAIGRERVLGEPISEAFLLENEGIMVQYFQNLRLEYAMGEPQTVRISPLGTWGVEGLREVVRDDVPDDGRFRTFPETNETIQDEFLTFYEDHNGEQVLGWPISPQLVVGGVRTQYFENGRLEWRPQFPLDQRVQLGWLGREHFDSEMVFIYREIANAAPVTAAGISEINIVASVQSPVVYAGDPQRLFVTVLTPEGDQVTGVTVTAVMQHDGTTTELELGSTNEDGKLADSLALADVSPGQDVELLIVVEDNGRVLGQTQLKFRTWW